MTHDSEHPTPNTRRPTPNAQRIVLVTGGARSGKSGFAEALARQRGRPVAYIATAEAGDVEMADRIGRHQAQRPAEWVTLEIPLDLNAGWEQAPADTGVVLIDCLVFWTTNRLLALSEPERDGWWADVEALETTLCVEMEALMARARLSGRDLILVTNEVGLGLVPMVPLGRAFRDMLGRLNQIVARQADAVFLVTAGLAVELKQIARTPERWEREVWSR